jgi:hypothetical protein
MRFNSKPSSEFIKVTPVMAMKWLGQNYENNRKSRDWHVDELSNAIQKDEWITTHQGIAFDTNGNLIDGQHRLQAIIAADKAVTMLVVRNLTPASFGVIDAGMKRTLADRTGLDQRLAETCRLFSAIAYGNKVVSAAETNRIANTAIGEVHERLIKKCPRHASYFSSAAQRVAAVTLVINGVDEDKVFDSYARMVYMNLTQLTPIEASLIRQATGGTAKVSDKRGTITRGLKAMDPKNARNTKLVMTPNEIELAVELVRATLKAATGEI